MRWLTWATQRGSGPSKAEKTRRNIVAKAVGLEKGAIYGHFSSKEELALEAFNIAWADAVQKHLRNLDTVGEAVDKLKLHVKNYVDTRRLPLVESRR
jgi:AcrR family transcriptional regulator